jgi:inner membrane protein involved in colicin E2 resistance
VCKDVELIAKCARRSRESSGFIFDVRRGRAQVMQDDMNVQRAMVGFSLPVSYRIGCYLASCGFHVAYIIACTV